MHLRWSLIYRLNCAGLYFIVFLVVKWKQRQRSIKCRNNRLQLVKQVSFIYRFLVFLFCLHDCLWSIYLQNLISLKTTHYESLRLNNEKLNVEGWANVACLIEIMTIWFTYIVIWIIKTFINTYMFQISLVCVCKHWQSLVFKHFYCCRQVDKYLKLITLTFWTILGDSGQLDQQHIKQEYIMTQREGQVQTILTIV